MTCHAACDNHDILSDYDIERTHGNLSRAVTLGGSDSTAFFSTMNSK